jgi:transposase
MRVTTIGLDIAKTVFQVHGVDAGGEVIIRQRLARRRVLAFFEKLAPYLVGIEARSTSHYWARELTARGHQVRLLPAQYVKPYVKRGKNDAADAEAICEAVTRRTMRFVPVKTPEQQSVMMLHRVGLMLNRQRTQLSNSIRAHLSEFGIVAPIGRGGIDQLLAIVADEKDTRVPAGARLCLQCWQHNSPWRRNKFLRMIGVSAPARARQTLAAGSWKYLALGRCSPAHS